VSESTVWQEVTRHVVALRRYALALTRDPGDAEDLVQECLTRAIAAADTWREGTSMRTWLFRILHNAHVDSLRRQKVRKNAALPPPLPPQKEGQMLRLEIRDVLVALARIPEPQRRAILLVALEEMRYEEAAALLGIPMGTFMSRLARGREALRRILEGENVPALRVVGGNT
jgi:RNA polymerase sigma-70 factor (ECF subfamily)